MINDLNEMDTSTKEGKLALALLSIITTTSREDKTPDEVIAEANKLIPLMFTDN